MFMPKIIFDMPLNHREITVYRCLCDKANKKGRVLPFSKNHSKGVENQFQDGVQGAERTGTKAAHHKA